MPCMTLQGSRSSRSLLRQAEFGCQEARLWFSHPQSLHSACLGLASRLGRDGSTHSSCLRGQMCQLLDCKRPKHPFQSDCRRLRTLGHLQSAARWNPLGHSQYNTRESLHFSNTKFPAHALVKVYISLQRIERFPRATSHMPSSEQEGLLGRVEIGRAHV